MKQKKSAVDLTELALGIIVLGITVSIGAVILTNYRDTRLSDLSTITTTNETLTTVAETGEVLQIPYFLSLTSVNNGTETFGINSANYTLTLNADNGYATLAYSYAADDASVNNTDWIVTYESYNLSDPQWNLPHQAATGLAEYGNWFEILVIVGVAAVVLSLIFLAFGGRGGGGGDFGGSTGGGVNF